MCSVYYFEFFGFAVSIDISMYTLQEIDRDNWLRVIRIIISAKDLDSWLEKAGLSLQKISGLFERDKPS